MNAKRKTQIAKLVASGVKPKQAYEQTKEPKNVTTKAN